MTNSIAHDVFGMGPEISKTIVPTVIRTKLFQIDMGLKVMLVVSRILQIAYGVQIIQYN